MGATTEESQPQALQESLRQEAPSLGDDALSWVTALGFICAYAALAFCGYALKVNSALPGFIWPSGGLLFAVLLVLRRRDWAWILLMAVAADIAVNWLTPPWPFIGFSTALQYALSNALKSLIGAMLARHRIGGLSAPRQAASLYFAGAIGCMFSTTISAVTFSVQHPEVKPLVTWLLWWAGDVLGIVTVAPLALTWYSHWRRPDRSGIKRGWLRPAILNGLLIAVTIAIFGAVPAYSTFYSGLQFAVLPILIVLALQSPTRWTMLGAALMTALAVALTTDGLGPFSDSSQLVGGVFSLQMFLMLSVGTTFILSVAADENRGLLAALTVTNEHNRRDADLLRAEVKRREALEEQHADAERRNNQLASLVLHSQEFIGILTLDGRVDFLNEFGRELVGVKPQQSLGELSVRDVVHPNDRKRLELEVLPDVKATGKWSGELTFRQGSDGSAVPMLAECFVIDDDLGRPLWLAMVCLDITARKNSEMNLRESEEKLRALFGASNVGIVLTDADTRYVDFNETFRRMTGYSAEELLLLDYRLLTAEEFRASTDAQLDEAKRSGRYGPYEKDYVRRDGSRLPVRLNGVRFADSHGGSFIWTIVEDITEQRHLERALLEATNKEQQKLGRDVHDGLGQELAGIAMLASAVRSSLQKAGRSEAAELAELESVARQAIANCRAIAHGLSPVAYATGGLVGGLTEMVMLQRNSFGIDAHLSVKNAESLCLTVDAAENLYRIAQEAVTNARRHGHTDSIEVTLDVRATSVCLKIQDSGVGIASTAAAATGMGLRIMQVRAATIGATLSVGPGDQGGTVVSIVCPQSAADS